MRLIRLGALFGSLMLLAATLVSMVNQRSELFDQQDQRVVIAMTTTTTSINTTLLRARAVVEISTADTVPSDLLRTFAAGAQACVDTSCSGPDLAALGAYGAATTGLQPGSSVAVVDRPSNSVLVVGRSATTTASVQLPVSALIGSVEQATLAGLDVEFSMTTSDSNDTILANEIQSIDGRRVLTAQAANPPDEGSIRIETSVPDDVGWGADTPGLYALLLGFSTVLLALAGWTFRAESRQLKRRATTDELTGLANRREFERQSEEAIEMAGRFGTGLCVMLIDLNGFKQINDTLGHQFGDLVLKACADRLLDAVRETDVVGRWGGDEFVVLLPGLADSSAVRNSAERIGMSLSATPVAGDVSISGSIGAALYPRHGHTLGDLMQAADVAMYEAKTTGVVHRVADAVIDGAPAARSGYDGPDRRKQSHRRADQADVMR